ncbi:MAG TPA: diguanylate cyclase [Candidatus Dormibacteraeota bacterium]|nr:diguanylate cyclase [Candidatus Dormibacteraeota bacterium]
MTTEPPIAQSQALKLGRVLIVDDEAPNRNLLTRRLAAAGYEAVAVEDGESALDLMADWGPDIVLLDLMMPGLSGFDVLERKALLPAIVDIPVVMVSAVQDEASRLRGLELGAVDYINKPFSTPELQARVRNLVRLHQQQIELNRLNAELEKLNGQLEHLAVSDALTGIANRRLFESRWEMECDRSQRYQAPLSIVVIDIDHFKRINDLHGHAAGDTILRAVAQGLSSCVRDVDMLARTGGEEFAVICPHSSGTGAEVLAERLRQAVRDLDLRDPDIKCTISAGVASSSDVPVPVLLEAADRALYRAKAGGRDRVERWHGEIPV